MEVVLYNPKSDKIVIKKDSKNRKYSTLAIYEQSGYKFILCTAYTLNLLPASKSVNEDMFKVLFFSANLDIYMNDANNDFTLDTNELLIAIDEDNNFYDGLEILETFKMSKILAKR